jgi:hypothetical protein
MHGNDFDPVGLDAVKDRVGESLYQGAPDPAEDRGVELGVLLEAIEDDVDVGQELLAPRPTRRVSNHR